MLKSHDSSVQFSVTGEKRASVTDGLRTGALVEIKSFLAARVALHIKMAGPAAKQPAKEGILLIVVSLSLFRRAALLITVFDKDHPQSVHKSKLDLKGAMKRLLSIMH